jgi:hypothetical protein
MGVLLTRSLDRCRGARVQGRAPQAHAHPEDRGRETMLIVYTLFWSKPRWTFGAEGRNAYGHIVASTTAGAFNGAEESAPEALELELEPKPIITL